MPAMAAANSFAMRGDPDDKRLRDAETNDWIDSRFHDVPVVFRDDPTVNDPNRLFLTWRCERRDSDFKCWRIH